MRHSSIYQVAAGTSVFFVALLACAQELLPAREYPARVLRVLDGDTFEADIDLGFDVHLIRKIRLQGWDTPERKQKGHDEAAAYLKNRLKPGHTVVLDKVKKGKYAGRVVAHVQDLFPLSKDCMRYYLPYFGGKKPEHF